MAAAHSAQVVAAPALLVSLPVVQVLSQAPAQLIPAREGGSRIEPVQTIHGMERF